MILTNTTRRRLTILALLFPFFAMVLNAQDPAPAGSGKISGTIRRMGTGQPIAGALVVLWNDTDPLRYARTDRSGAFVFKDLPAHAYFMEIKRSGYVFDDKFCSQGCEYTLQAGQTIESIAIELVPAGAVSGVVSERGGKPLPLAEVDLLTAGYDVHGQRTFHIAHSTRANDRGEYRFFDLTPGRYYLAAGAPPGPAIALRLREVYERAYYPAENSVSRAAPIDIRPGDELLGRNFWLVRQPVFRIRGRVTEAATGAPPSTLSLVVIPADGSSTASSYTVFTVGFQNETYDPVSGSYDEQSGVFEVRGVLPGTYTLMAILESPGPDTIKFRTVGRAEPSDEEKQKQAQRRSSAGYAAVSVANADVEDVRLVVEAGGSLAGRITVEGKETALPPLKIELSPVIDGIVQGKPLTKNPAADGTFNIDQVRPGLYRLSVEFKSEGYYIKEARFGAADVLQNDLLFTGPNSGTLNLVITPSNARVSGNVFNDAAQPQAEAFVIFVPDSGRQFIVRTANEDGRFTAVGIPPGDYRVFAYPRQTLEQYAFRNAEFLAEIKAYEVPLHVTEGANPVLSLKLVPASRSDARE